MCRTQKMRRYGQEAIMGLYTLRELLIPASAGEYAVGSFNFFGLENLQGILLAAAQLHAPVIVQASPGAVRHIGEKGICGLTRSLAEEYGVTAALHLDHATELDFIFRCVDNGFTSVMIDASKKSFSENVELTQKVVEYAHRNGVSVEAELGRLGGAEEEIRVSERDALFTDPEEAVRFVALTGVDALAIAVGTAHGFYKFEPDIDFDRIREIHAKTNSALVLHGGTGVSDSDLRRAIEAGISKINVGTELWYNGYGNTMKKYAEQMPYNSDPRKVMAKVREACREIVLKKIEIFGSAGRETGGASV